MAAAWARRSDVTVLRIAFMWISLGEVRNLYALRPTTFWATADTGLEPFSASMRTDPAIARTTSRIRAVAAEAAVEHGDLRYSLVMPSLRTGRGGIASKRRAVFDRLPLKDAFGRRFPTSRQIGGGGHVNVGFGRANPFRRERGWIADIGSVLGTDHTASGQDAGGRRDGA